ncbi:MAG: hypothetical protein HYY16_19480 [Planctomycetes bacterium]|nr:hypothetical protein [Planctomycetota bacterium]
MIAVLFVAICAQEIQDDLEQRVSAICEWAAANELEKADDAYEELYREEGKDGALSRAHKAIGGWEHERRLARRLRESAHESLDALNEPDIRTALASLKGLRERFGADPDDEVEKLTIEVEGYPQQLADRLHLASLKLALSGTGERQVIKEMPVVPPWPFIGILKVPVRHREAWAIINHEICREGDLIAGTGVHLQVVNSHGCMLEFKGQIRHINMRFSR